MTTIQEAAPRPAELEQTIKLQVLQRTSGRIQCLEVHVTGDRIMVRGWTMSFHLKQLAIQGILDVISQIGGRHVDTDILVKMPSEK